MSVKGDYTRNKLVSAVRRSKIVGDVVEHYKRIAPSKLGVTFVTDVETAARVAEEFTAAGVPAEVVHAETPDRERVSVLKRFKARKLLQLVNVDLFGEGFDLPAIEVVSMARPTQSYGLYVQQFGRALRLMDGKTEAIIIDHVGNVLRHGLPDAPRDWSLARREKRASSSEGVTPVKACPECAAVYERFHPACPYCGYKPIPAARNGPEFVDGDLLELDAETLARMRSDVARIDMTPAEFRDDMLRRCVPGVAQARHMRLHVADQQAQTGLRDALALWGGYQRSLGRPDAESYRRFYLEYGVDVLSAQALKQKQAAELNGKIIEYLSNKGVSYE